MGDLGPGIFLLNAFTGWPGSRIEYSSQEAKAKAKAKAKTQSRSIPTQLGTLTLIDS
jgi:hypothetical protein